MAKTKTKKILDDQDKWFLGWIYDRMINHHKEKSGVDYMRRFKKLIDDL